MSLKSTTGRSPRGSWRAKSVTLATGGMTSVAAGLLTTLVGKSTWNSTEFHNYSKSGPFELRNFHQNFIIWINKFVFANS